MSVTASKSVDIDEIHAAMARVQMSNMPPPSVLRASTTAMKILEQTLPIMQCEGVGPLESLLGMKVFIDPTMPDDEVEIRSGSQWLRIVGLGAAHK